MCAQVLLSLEMPQQIHPGQPSHSSRAPNARSGWDLNTSIGDPKLEQCIGSLTTNYVLESDITQENQALQVQPFKGPLAITPSQPPFFQDG